MFAEGLIHPRVHAVHPLDEVATALDLDRRAIGKTLLEVGRGV
jgi:NADPH2:quinone reductase